MDFHLDEKKTIPLLIGGGVGIPPLIFLANEIKEFSNLKPLILFGSEVYRFLLNIPHQNM